MERNLTGFPTTYDQDLGLMKLVELALGQYNERNKGVGITPQRFPLAGTGVRTVNLRVEPYITGETDERAAARLVSSGHILANTGDLAGFARAHPKEVGRWVGGVLAISKDSRWVTLDDYGHIYVPIFIVDRWGSRHFNLEDFLYTQRNSSFHGVLVVCEQ